jgi:Family of unknown function (DUF5762)
MFWLQNPNILLNPQQVLEIFPVSSSMSIDEQLNALTRFLILSTVILFFWRGRDLRIFLLLFLTLSSICVFWRYNGSASKKKDEEGYANRALNVLTASSESALPNESFELFDTPSSKNPYQNVLLTDYNDNPNKKPAEPSSTDDFLKAIGEGKMIENNTVLEEAKKLVLEMNPGQNDLANKLFKDMSDQYVFEQSLRPFYSTASTTIPNDQSGFAEFCYGSMISCKEGNMFACAKNLI